METHLKIVLAYPMADGWLRAEASAFVTAAVLHAEMSLVGQRGPCRMDLIQLPISRFPTDVARNNAVKVAQENGADLLVTIDDDMRVPPAFFQHAVEFLVAHKGSAAIGVPYCTGGNEAVTVHEWAATHTRNGSMHPNGHTNIKHIGREDAARRMGIERVPNLGTGCIAYTMSCFDKVTKPYYRYSYNEDHTVLMETEECYCHRRLCFAGVPLYVHWDFWADHWKGCWIEKPAIIETEEVRQFFARALEPQIKDVPLMEGSDYGRPIVLPPGKRLSPVNGAAHSVYEEVAE